MTSIRRRASAQDAGQGNCLRTSRCLRSAASRLGSLVLACRIKRGSKDNSARQEATVHDAMRAAGQRVSVCSTMQEVLRARPRLLALNCTRTPTRWPTNTRCAWWPRKLRHARLGEARTAQAARHRRQGYAARTQQGCGRHDSSVSPGSCVGATEWRAFVMHRKVPLYIR